jgi:hypothetical protein
VRSLEERAIVEQDTPLTRRDMDASEEKSKRGKNTKLEIGGERTGYGLESNGDSRCKQQYIEKNCDRATVHPTSF